MKFTDIILLYVVTGFFLISIASGLRLCNRLGRESELKRQEISCSRFISESFRNTCKGKGFKNLNEWQTACRALWQLDYICWSKADEFMIDESGRRKNELFYGKWNGHYGNGEVFCRERRSENAEQ